MEASPNRRISRETRLLLVTITISALVLVLLSRLRFPESPATVEAPPAPLERLAATATYTELAAIVAGLERRIAPSLVVLRVAFGTDVPPRALSDVIGPGNSDQVFRHVPALRMGEGTALAAVGSEARIIQVAGDGGATAAEILATDSIRNLSLVKIPSATPEFLPQLRLREMNTPSYVVAVEGTRAGLTFRPVFVGTKDRFNDSRWSRPLLAVSSVALTSPGALVFSLEGSFLGCAFLESGALAIVPAGDIIETADRLSKGGPVHPVDIGISVQQLTPEISATLGVDTGLVVAEVVDGGPAGDSLQFGDIITHLDDEPAGYAGDFLLRVARREPGTVIKLSIIRKKERLVASITVPTPSPQASGIAGGLRLRPVRGVGSVVTELVDGSLAHEAGLRVGDVIAQAGDIKRPSPARVYSMVRAMDSSGYLPLAITRDGRRRLVVLAGPSLAEDPR